MEKWKSDCWLLANVKLLSKDYSAQSPKSHPSRMNQVRSARVYLPAGITSLHDLIKSYHDDEVHLPARSFFSAPGQGTNRGYNSTEQNQNLVSGTYLGVPRSGRIPANLFDSSTR
jgi:hypothetical protein